MTRAQRNHVYDLLTNDLLDLSEHEVAQEAGVSLGEVRRIQARIRERVQTVPWAFARRVAQELGWEGDESSLMTTALMRMLAEKRRA